MEQITVYPKGWLSRPSVIRLGIAIVGSILFVGSARAQMINYWCGGSGPAGLPMCGGACCTGPTCFVFPDLHCANLGECCGCVSAALGIVSPNCPVCGNGAHENPEECDDGNTFNGDGCDDQCRREYPFCPNGIVEAGEQCDDGNRTEGDGCDSNCTFTGCGNGTVTAGEQCDGGPLCSANCTFLGCGNSPYPTCGGDCGAEWAAFVDCTSVANTCGCLFHDRFPCAGGGSVDCNLCAQLGHTCFDLGGGTCACGWVATACGNGRLESGEQCDDGNLIDDDGCDLNCTLTGCGNGRVTSGEECDDGNANSQDGCKADCTLNYCGDGVANLGVEQCDDGNSAEGDGCDSTCEATGCGSGVVTDGEACDDGNLTSGDGCSSSCHTELFSGRTFTLLAGAAPRMTLVSKDTAMDLGSGNLGVDDPVLMGGTLRVFSAGFDATYVLEGGPNGAWDYIGRVRENKGYRYRDSLLLRGPIKSVVIRGGKSLRIVGRGDLLGFSLATNPDPVVVTLQLGNRSYCMSFGGIASYVTGHSFRARNASVAPSCPA